MSLALGSGSGQKAHAADDPESGASTACNKAELDRPSAKRSALQLTKFITLGYILTCSCVVSKCEGQLDLSSARSYAASHHKGG